MATASNSPCGACKFLRRKCAPECTFAPYFPPDQPLKFSNAHKIFGASNISKILSELPVHQRAAAVNSLAYEAQARMKDPVYGCVGAISYLKRHIEGLENELRAAKAELARYVEQENTGPGLLQLHQRLAISLQGSPNDTIRMIGAGADHHQAMVVTQANNTDRAEQIWMQQQHISMYEEEFVGNRLEMQMAATSRVAAPGSHFLHGTTGTADGRSPSSTTGEGASNLTTLSSPS